MIGNFPPGLGFAMRPENDGNPFHVDPDDPGGATKWGITMPALSDWRMENGSPTPTVRDLENLAEFERDAIYAANYWLRVNGDRLPLGVDLMVFDFGVTSGAAMSAKVLQRVAGLSDHFIDGWVGDQTILALSSVPPFKLVSDLATVQEEYYKACPAAWKYLDGWERRLDDRRRLAVSMLVHKSTS